jgi:hypothetical protein
MVLCRKTNDETKPFSTTINKLSNGSLFCMYACLDVRDKSQVQNRIGEGDGPILLRRLHKFGTVPAVLKPALDIRHFTCFTQKKTI